MRNPAYYIAHGVLLLCLASASFSASDTEAPLSHSSAIPPASGYADINDSGKMPFKSEKARERYIQYLKAKSPKALAISLSGFMAFEEKNTDAMQAALDSCNKAEPIKACRLYAVDDTVVYPLTKDRQGSISINLYIKDGDETDSTTLIRNKWQPKVQEIANLFDTSNRDLFGFTLQENVALYITANDYDYRFFLQDHLGYKEDYAKKLAWRSAGISSYNGKIGLAFVNAYNSKAWPLTVAAHELTHELQNQLTSSADNDPPQWIVEGVADYYAYFLLESLRLPDEEYLPTTLKQWEKHVADSLRNNRWHASFDELSVGTNQAWHKLLAEEKSPYPMAGLMIIHLSHLVGADFNKAWFKYFELAGQNDFLHEDAFKSSFGISLTDFKTSFEAWYEKRI